jgi:hypothetical protein
MFGFIKGSNLMKYINLMVNKEQDLKDVDLILFFSTLVVTLTTK